MIEINYIASILDFKSIFIYQLTRELSNKKIKK